MIYFFASSLFFLFLNHQYPIEWYSIHFLSLFQSQHYYIPQTAGGTNAYPYLSILLQHYGNLATLLPYLLLKVGSCVGVLQSDCPNHVLHLQFFALLLDIYPPNIRKGKMLHVRHFLPKYEAAHPYHLPPTPHQS